MSAYTHNEQEARHTDDLQDIIIKVPSWILRWGITLFFGILVLLIGLSAFIRYPDVVEAKLQIQSPNSPKLIVSAISGKMVKLLVTENEMVKSGQPLAYLESTANHEKVLNLLTNLKQIQQRALQNKPFNSSLLNRADDIQLGELQTAYQSFFSEYLSYSSSVDNGFLIKKWSYLQKDLNNIADQQKQLYSEKNIEQRDSTLANDEYEMHKKLTQNQVETKAELRQEESKFLAKKSSLIQTESSIINGNDNYDSKQKEILELNNQIQEEKGKFLQALNSLISSAEDWKLKYILTASQSGKLTYAGIVQENQILALNQEVFYINPGNEQFFGEMAISQNNIGKVKEGQWVLIKLKGYPFEEYGMIRGRIKYISDVPYKDSAFMSEVDLKSINSSDLKKPIHLKQGMMADAEIITQDATILQRISRSLIKLKN